MQQSKHVWKILKLERVCNISRDHPSAIGTYGWWNLGCSASWVSKEIILCCVIHQISCIFLSLRWISNYMMMGGWPSCSQKQEGDLYVFCSTAPWFMSIRKVCFKVPTLKEVHSKWSEGLHLHEHNKLKSCFEGCTAHTDAQTMNESRELVLGASTNKFSERDAHLLLNNRRPWCISGSSSTGVKSQKK